LEPVITGLTSVSSTGFTGALIGNATSATKLETGRTISMTGDVSYTSTSFDGSGNVTGIGTLSTVLGTPGPYGSSSSIPGFTVNDKGLITAVTTHPVVAPAGTLSGTTLASGVTASSLTSVGVITSGTWNGTLGTIDWTSPGVIGSVAPNTASFTTVNISNIIHLTPLSSAPAGALGDLYVSTDGNIYFYSGGWKAITHAP
jgi:hypothetical protein